MRGGMRVIGYHGTSAGGAKKILRNGFRASDSDAEWLGRGIYFFEEDEGRARDWAKAIHADAPAVLGAAIDVGSVLDLFDQPTTDDLKSAAKQIVKAHAAVGKPLPVDESGLRRFDCALIN